MVVTLASMKYIVNKEVVFLHSIHSDQMMYRTTNISRVLDVMEISLSNDVQCFERNVHVFRILVCAWPGSHFLEFYAFANKFLKTSFNVDIFVIIYKIKKKIFSTSSALSESWHMFKYESESI